MNISSTRQLIRNPLESISRTRIKSATIYGGIIIGAMIAFEAFNYGTTQYALKDLLGDLKFAGFSWATLMALAFCGLDFAGIARLINQKGRSESPKESWYLFGAWLIAGTFNAALTWWGVSIAIANHTLRSAAVVSAHTLTSIVPVFVAILVWVVRILIIGSLSSALERISDAHNLALKSRAPITASNNFTTRRQAATGFVSQSTVTGSHEQAHAVPSGFHPIPGSGKSAKF
jgi:hypothetical protein